jgi:uncharacterized membrane protein YphA (DoxX/SURF4 family)
MKIVRQVPRVLLGLVFLVFGLNGFFNFIKMAPPPADAMAFFGALVKTGYFIPLLKGTEVVAAVLLLSNRFVPLALTVLAPILVNILFFHVALEPSGAPMAIILVGLEVYLAWSYREVFRPLLASRVAPSVAGSSEGRVVAHAE